MIKGSKIFNEAEQGLLTSSHSLRILIMIICSLCACSNINEMKRQMNEL